ncbi:MAG TPA: hypothetical protein VLH40_09560 [Atribacteraceae bacterium]|nr:hypothetical protein [Atribacteraceae bacterium]
MKKYGVWLVVSIFITLFIVGCTPHNERVAHLRINGTLDSLEDAALRQSPEEILGHYSFPYTYEINNQILVYSREEYLAQISEHLEIVEIAFFRLEDRHLTLFDGDTAQVETIHRIAEIEEGIRYTMTIKAILTMERTGGVWTISRYAIVDLLEFTAEPA